MRGLEAHLADLSGRLRRGSVSSAGGTSSYISKDDGRQRPLGVPALEDKIAQRATVEVINGIYETDFLGFSYGYRPGRSQHNALDALYVGLLTKKVNWVLDVDIRGFFDTIGHGWLVTFVEHRIADRRVVRLIQKWLNAGVWEEGSEHGWRRDAAGRQRVALLANVYLHYVFDLWVQAWRQKHAHGDVIVVRFADDIVVGFQVRSDAERFWAELAERFRKFHLELHAEKTRLLEFGPYAAERRKKRGLGKPETFNFLGFTHLCGKKRSNGRFTVRRQTIYSDCRRNLVRRPTSDGACTTPFPQWAHGCARWSGGTSAITVCPPTATRCTSFGFRWVASGIARSRDEARPAA